VRRSTMLSFTAIMASWVPSTCKLHQDEARITNPGGFVVGVHAGNLLAVAPRPRNPLLADIFKRVRLVEKTGRGVGIIYAGQLRNGRPAPTYDRSSETSVTVVLDSGPSDLDFVLLSIHATRQLGRLWMSKDCLSCGSCGIARSVMPIHWHLCCKEMGRTPIDCWPGWQGAACCGPGKRSIAWNQGCLRKPGGRSRQRRLITKPLSCPTYKRMGASPAAR